MIFKTKRTLSPYDVPIANVQVRTVGSHDMVQLTDMSTGIAGNNEAAVTSVASRPLGSGTVGHEYRLQAKNVYGEIELTDEIYDDRTTGISAPLWYVHSVKRPYYNTTVVTRSIRRHIKADRIDADRIIMGLLPSNTKSLIVFGSVVIQDVTAATTLAPDEYSVNYDATMVTIRRDKAVGNHTYTITYDIISADVTVTAPMDTYWRFEVERIVDSVDDYFHLRLLSTDSRPFKVTYTSYGDEEVVRSYEEYTYANPIFTEVPEAVRQAIVADPLTDSIMRRVFSYEEVGSYQYIQTYSQNPDRVFHFRSNTALASKIHLLKPAQHHAAEDWYMNVTAGRFTGSSSRLFTVSMRPGIDDFEDVTETATFVDSTTLWLSRQNVIFYITGDHTIGGITITRTDGTSVSINSVDSQRGIVYLSESVSQQDILQATYRVYTGYRTCTRACLNPLLTHHDHNFDAKNKVFAFFLAPSSFCQDNDLPVYVKPLDQYDSLDFLVYTRAALDASANSADAGVRTAFRADIIGLPDVLKTSADRLEILGTVYLSNPLDEDGYLLEDARIFGGGSSDRIRSAFDYSYYDGEATDLEPIIRVHIPQAIVDDLVAKAIEWNPEVVALDTIAARQELARQRVHEYIQAKVKKFSMLGTVQEIVFDE